MKQQPTQRQNPPEGDERPEVYSVSQDRDGSFHFSRRDFLYVSAALGGAMVLRGVCPRFGAASAPSDLVQAGMSPFPGVYIHTEPSIASNIVDTLQQNDLVRLISDHSELGWAEVATRNVQHGWVKRSSVDFSRAIRSSSPDFGLSSPLAPTPTQTHPPLTLSIRLRNEDNGPQKASPAGQAESSIEVIQNGNFEAGSASWAEESPGYIVRDDWPDPYQGSWVAWMGGPDASERLTQLFHVPADVQDAQKLEFYIQVTTQETGNEVYDTFRLRFLNADGDPISNDIAIADNTTPTDWVYISVDIQGMTGLADQDVQIQFEGLANSTNDTSFVIDSVSLNLLCGPPPIYVYLPVIVRMPTPTPTATTRPTSTPRPSATPCPSHNSCPSDCSIDYCSSDCTLDCIYDCPFDCIYDCSYDYCGYDCSYDW